MKPVNGVEVSNPIQLSLNHRVFFSRDVFSPKSQLLFSQLSMPEDLNPARCLVFMDEGLVDHNPDLPRVIDDYFSRNSSQVALVGEPKIISGGEKAKSDLKNFLRILKEIESHRLCRHSYVIAVGGGAVLDAVGFAASLVHRGLRQVRVPTTVLAQCDAGIGIKNGINWRGQKNFLGTFQVPHLILNDFKLLETLTDEDWRDGTAEAVKVALIRDREFFEWIEKNTKEIMSRDSDAMELLIRRCAELHLRQITKGGDPFELGSSRPLDFGHWLAHKLERTSGFQLTHGHSVAVGIAVDSLYSSRLGLLSPDEFERILFCLSELGFPLRVVNRIDPGAGLKGEGLIEALLGGVADFQEHLGGRLTLTLIKEIGVPVEVSEIDGYQMRQVLRKIILGSADF